MRLARTGPWVGQPRQTRWRPNPQDVQEQERHHGPVVFEGHAGNVRTGSGAVDARFFVLEDKTQCHSGTQVVGS